MGESILKTYDASVSLEAGKREVLAIISTDVVDRDGEVVQPKGLRKKNYAGNPIVLVNHDYRSLPIGTARWVKADGDKVLAKYYVSDRTQMARDIFGLLQDGVLSAHSIGFQSVRNSPPSTQEKNARPDLKDARLIHREWELLEFSVVGIPANPEALTLAVSKGYSPETLKMLGSDAHVEQKAAEVIEAVKEKRLTTKELIRAIEKQVGSMAITVNVDQVLAKAFSALKR